MRRALLPLLLACACSASPSPPPPPASPHPAPAPAPPAAPRASWLELTTHEKDTALTRRDPEGRAVYEVRLGRVSAAIGAADGGAYAVVEEATKYSPGKAVQIRTLIHVDGRGHEAWRVTQEGGGWDWRLFEMGGRLFAFDLVSPAYQTKRKLHVIDAASGARLRDTELDPSLTDVDARGGVLVAVDARGVMRLGPEGDPLWSVRVRLFPSLDPTASRVADRKVKVGLDGTVLTGASDGSLLALDPEGKPLWQLGVRGAVSSVDARPAPSGAAVRFIVRRHAGLAASVGGGHEDAPSPSGDPAPPEGGQVIDKRSGKKAEESVGEAPPWRPTAAYRARPEGPDGKPFQGVRSLVALGPGDVWALAHVAPAAGADAEDRLFHHDGRAWSDHGAPSVRFAKEVFAEGRPPAAGKFYPHRLARGPNGALLVLGARVASEVRLCVLERVGTELRERRELFAALAKIPVEGEANPTYAVSPGGREILCNGAPQACVAFGRGAAPTVVPDGEGRTLPGATGEAQTARGRSLIPALFAGETLWKANGWASGEGDVWGVGEGTLTHWDGAAFKGHPSPLGPLASVWASGRDDLWLTGVNGGVARFDGQRWWRILGVAGDPHGRDLAVTGGGRGDVWVFGEGGLWHVTPDPEAQPDVEGTPLPPPPAAAPSLALPIAGAEPGYRLERAALDVDGGKPLRAAIDVVGGPGGVVWLHDGARVVEHDGARARVIYQAPRPDPFVCWSAPEPDCEGCAACNERKPKALDCQRCVAPSAAGEGALFTAEEGWLRVHGGRATPDPMPLSALLAAAVAPSGALWSVSAAAGDDLPHAQIRGPRGVQLVVGLPPAAYADVAVRADDDVWMAGGLTSAESGRPEGEGTLVHFDGRSFTRHRAPDGALLSVAAVGPGEAWAVGLGGGVLHVKGGAATALHLERLPVILRGVAAAGPNEVWMVGDGATLLRWDGSALGRVDASAAGKEAALSAVVAPGASPGWVVGPSGIFRVVRGR